MSDGKHTPGEWALDDEPDAEGGVPFLLVSAGEAGTDSYREIARVQPTFVEGPRHGADEFSIQPEDIANARLIAAAPSLADALKEAVAAINAVYQLHTAEAQGQDRSADRLDAQIQAARAKARAALLKAGVA